MFVPGDQDHRSLVNTVRNLLPMQMEMLNAVTSWKYKDFIDNQFVIAGSPASVRDQLMQAVKKLRVGNLMVLLHIGSMPHELTLKNIDLFAREVQPHFRNVWDEEDGTTNGGRRESRAMPAMHAPCSRRRGHGSHKQMRPVTGCRL